MQKGFTLIEVMIVVAILAILAAFVAPIAFSNSSTRWSWYGGWTEETCIGGFKFVQSRHVVTQILDTQGHGVTCK